MKTGQIGVLDISIVAAYLIFMVVIGVLLAKRVRNTDDFYVAGRTLGPLVLMATVCATTLGGSAMLGRAGLAYTDGFKCVMTAIPYTIGMFVFSSFAGRIQQVGKRYRIRSIPALYRLFSKQMGREQLFTEWMTEDEFREFVKRHRKFLFKPYHQWEGRGDTAHRHRLPLRLHLAVQPIPESRKGAWRNRRANHPAPRNELAESEYAQHDSRRRRLPEREC